MAESWIRKASESIQDKADLEKWFAAHPHNETTVMKCDKCGLFSKPSLEHKCPKRKSV